MKKKFYLFIFFLIHNILWTSTDIPSVPLDMYPNSRKTLTGDWGGERNSLENAGVSIHGSYTADSLANPIGGSSVGISYTGSLGADITLDFGKIAGLNGLQFYNSWVWRRGNSLSASKIQNQFPVQQVYGTQTVQLNSLYFQYNTPQKIWTVKFGRLSEGDDFLQNDLYYYFVSNAFCGNPIAVFFNIPSFTAYPVATWGVFTKIQPIENLSVKIGAYNAKNHLGRSRYHGMNFTFSNDQGIQYIGETKIEYGQKLTRNNVPGSLAIGACTFSKKSPLINSIENKRNATLYVQADQMIYRIEDPVTLRGISPFVALLFADPSQNTFPFFCTTGIVSRGINNRRIKDVFSVGFAYGKYSRVLQNQEKLQGEQEQDFEAVIECNYLIQVNEWSTVQPDVQYIIHPKGYHSRPNALAIGLQFSLVF